MALIVYVCDSKHIRTQCVHSARAKCYLASLLWTAGMIMCSPGESWTQKVCFFLRISNARKGSKEINALIDDDHHNETMHGNTISLKSRPICLCMKQNLQTVAYLGDVPFRNWDTYTRNLHFWIRFSKRVCPHRINCGARDWMRSCTRCWVDEIVF